MPWRSWFRGSAEMGERAGLRAVVAVVLVGVAASFGVAGYIRAEVQTGSRENLAAHGELLVDAMESDVQVVTEQVRGLRGLFEASSFVTAREFQLFSEIVGFSPSSELMFAAREEGPGGDLSWQVEHVVAAWVFGARPGEDLSGDPVQMEAIGRTVLNGRPAVSRLLSLDNDGHLSDVGVFQAVTSRGLVVGVVGAFVQLDVLIDRAAQTVLGPGEEWGLEDSAGDSVGVSTAFEWSRSVEIGGQSFRLWLTSDHVLDPGASRPLLVLIAGLVLTALGARLAVESERRGRSDREIEWLRRSAADKDRFLAGVGHELRTPLTVVVGMLDLAADPGRELTPDERIELIAIAGVQAHEISRIVDDFVTAGRLTSDALTVRSLPTELDPIVAKTIASSPRDLRVVVTAVTDLGECLGDGLRIAQILLNILGNALRNARTRVEIRGHMDDRFVTVEVCNDGPPIATEDGYSLFEPFTAVRPEGQPQPVGLGLSVSRALARRMGGDLIYQHRDGQVVFSLLLPAVPSPVQVETPATV